MNDFYPESKSDRGDISPEIRTCRASRAEVHRYLVHARNTLPAKLERLDCSEAAGDALFDWLEGIELALPDAEGLAESLLDPKLDPAEFNHIWETIESMQCDCAQLPETATEYLEQVARHANADKLALLYWAHLHYPLCDRFDDLQSSVKTLLSRDELVRRRKKVQMHENAEAREDTVTVYSYNTMDLHGDSFGWQLILYRKDGRYFAETHQWVSSGDAHAPSIEEIDSGRDLADTLRAGECDGIWQISQADYREAVERVFQLDTELGIDFLDALHHEYDVNVEIGNSGRADLRAAWVTHLEELEAASGKEPDVEADEPMLGHSRPDRDDGTATPGCADPIKTILEEMQTEPARASGALAALSHAHAIARRRQSAKAYVIHYAQKHLQLPTGRHYISNDGRPGKDFWVEFPVPGESTPKDA